MPDKSLEQVATDIFLSLHPNFPPSLWEQELNLHMQYGISLGYSVAEVARVRELVEAKLAPLREQAAVYWAEKTKDWAPEC